MAEVPGQSFRIREFVRWGDVDKAGIIRYGAYVRFFEIAETELFRAAGLPFSKFFDEFDVWFPRKRMLFEFHSPALLDDLLEVEVWVGAIGRTSLRLEFAVSKADSDPRILTADGHVVVVAVDRTSFKPIPVPEGIVARLSQFVEKGIGRQ